ncbi:three-Cys-motif partner protein TcmP [Qipengyuania huizhouensis]|uniref:three-Cys-motif partner protein TcmP n=1 Tax=Qipengyuania huizhouensis TaxID=2867245 RepID=UPI001C86A14C|nr:three-Cys-motif partner protein TcmP [Qipengyuania huizhouensis]
MPGAKRAKNEFGGPWTEIKLDAVTDYLQFYQGALKNMGFETWYIDAFAGTGDRHAKVIKGGLLEAQPIEEGEEVLDGSARKALRINPPFTHYWFAEAHKGRQAQLAKLRTEFDQNITIYPGDANTGLRDLFGSRPWSDGPTKSKQRAVVFLDPFGMSVSFETLEVLAATKRVDVWYLFPRAATIQQLPHKHSALDHTKRGSLERIFGCADWDERFYAAQPAQGDFFGGTNSKDKIRLAKGDEIAAFARERFGSIFCYVSKPLPLLVNGNDFFELYCMSNNPRAIHLIEKGVKHVLKNYTPASRRTFGH